MTRLIVIIIIVGALLRYVMWLKEKSVPGTAEGLAPTPTPVVNDGLYCPTCGVQYLPGITQCADCAVALVKEKPNQKSEPEMESMQSPNRIYTHLAEVYLAIDVGEFNFVKAVLEDAEIPYSVEGDAPNNRYTFSRPTEMRVFVPKEFEAKTRELFNSIPELKSE
jgi:hypothetical protein